MCQTRKASVPWHPSIIGASNFPKYGLFITYHLGYLRDLGAIHSTKISGNFGPKLNGSVRSNRKSFEKTGPPFEVVLFSRSDRLEFWSNGSRPKMLRHILLIVTFYAVNHLRVQTHRNLYFLKQCQIMVCYQNTRRAPFLHEMRFPKLGANKTFSG